MSEANVLANVYENVRSLTKLYIARTNPIDSFKRWEVNGRLLNSRYWLIAHLVWTENFLLVRAMEGRDLDIPWMEKFEKGSEPVMESVPPLTEVIEQLDVVHTEAMSILRGMSDEDLASANHLGFGFGGEPTKRKMIHHAIRHEPCHIGQLGWLAKINGIEMP